MACIGRDLAGDKAKSHALFIFSSVDFRVCFASASSFAWTCLEEAEANCLVVKGAKYPGGLGTEDGLDDANEACFRGRKAKMCSDDTHLDWETV